jgi:hypothetical protein
MGEEVVKAIVKHSRGEEVQEQVLLATKLYRKADAENDPDLK